MRTNEHGELETIYVVRMVWGFLAIPTTKVGYVNLTENKCVYIRYILA